MIAGLLSYITRREGRKFLKLSEGIDDSLVTGRMLPPGQEAALYIHIPFCRTLCPFCCFNRYLFKEDLARRYFASLRRELDMYLERGFRFSSFYFGGGTPTVLMDELLGFIDYLRAKCTVNEVSLETTPAELSPQTVAQLKQAGIRRLSIGVQSFNDDVLKAMGRVLLTGAEVRERVLLAQGEFDTVNVDLIFNFPFQSLDQFRADVSAFRTMQIGQATFYPLMASPHKLSAMERRFNKVDPSRERAFYDVILKEVYDAGYRASTAWCFSRGDRMIDEYIIDFDDYVGIGAGSVSIVNGNFYVNSFAPERYGSLVDQGKLPIIGWRRLSEREALRYYLLTALFGMTLDPAKFRNRFHAHLGGKLGLEMSFLRIAGIVRHGEKVTVTRRGMFPVNIMMRDFFTALNGLREYCIEKQV